MLWVSISWCRIIFRLRWSVWKIFAYWTYSLTDTIAQVVGRPEDQLHKLDVLRAHSADRRSYSIYHSHLGVYPVQFPLGKHLLIAGPIIVYPGLQKYQTYCPAQWFSLWITTAALFGLPGSPQLGKSRKQSRQSNWFWSSTSCLRLAVLNMESWLTHG